MKTQKKPIPYILFFAILLTAPAITLAGVPDVEHVMVTDVTTVSFSVIWAASEASTASLEVFDDEDATESVSTAVITSHPVESDNLAIKEAAENNGVMKVRVTGLQAGTSYYFRTRTTSKSTDETAFYPDSPPMLPVQTELETVRTYTSGSDTLPFGNDVIIKECYLEDGTTLAEGTILLATVKGASHPLSVFVGDGVDLPNALIDLNNAFSRDSSQNLDLKSGENLTLLNFRGLQGYSIITHRVPEDQSLSEVKSPALALIAGWNMISCQLEPNNPDLLSALNPIIDAVESIYAYDSENIQWVFYEKYGWPFLNTLDEFHAATGYYVLTEDIGSLEINGSFSDAPIPLRVGRANLIAYRSIESEPLMDAVDSIYDFLESIWTYQNGEWIFYDKYGWPFLNTLEYVEPGKSYWVYVSADCQW